jgi:fructokinase
MFGICDLLESDLETALNEAQKVGAESCSYEGARGMMQQ